LTKQEVAKMFQISTRTLDRWRAMGIDLGEITINGTVRFDPAKVASIIAARKAKRRRG
jgi:DNA-binding transcriptional MerR regulator